MTNEERDELRRDLEAAGCEKLSRVVAWAHWNMPGANEFMQELQSLLRREERLRVMEAGVRAADRLTRITFGWTSELPYSHLSPREKHSAALEDREAFRAALKLLESEVPDGD